MPSVSLGNGRAAPICPIRATARPKGRSANTTASSWSAKWCCAAPRWRRRKGTRASAIAISSIRKRAGSSAGCGLLNSFEEMMVVLARSRRILPQAEEASAFEDDVLAGLRATPKRVPAKYFYDGTGSLLFERITELPEYYPTRCEMRILRARARDIVKL